MPSRVASDSSVLVRSRPLEGPIGPRYFQEGADVAAAKRRGLQLVMPADDLDVRLGHPSFGLHSRTGRV